MLSFYNIRSVALYEMKTLFRSWFFRILAILAILVIGFIDVMFFSGVEKNIPWIFRGLSSFIPLSNILLLNIVQTIIAIFLASDFLKRDRKMDTTEVIYMRSMTNGDYVLGKLLGILLVFLGLNIFILLIAGIINGIFADVPMDWFAYLFYPLALSLPSLMFVFGLAFLIMLLLRNQALTFIVLLGYAAICLFFIRERADGIFDFLGFYTPFVISDFIGVPNADLLWLQRGLYFLLGLVFVFATVLLFPRLPQSQALRRFSLAFIIIGLLTGVMMGYQYANYFAEGRSLRQQMNTLNAEIAEKPRLSIVASNLEVTHHGCRISVQDRLLVRNETDQALTEAFFSLNPGFRVTAVRQHGIDLVFSRRAHILRVQFSSPLAMGSSDSLEIEYNGFSDDRACFSWVSEEKRKQRFRIWVFTAAKQHAFITPKYVLLTPAALWYPISGVPAGSLFPRSERRDFIQFSLKVHCAPNLTLLTQGEVVQLSSGVYQANSEQKLPGLSLVIGRYQERAVTVDSIRYALFTLPQHDYFLPYFKDIGDTLSSVIRELRQDYERSLKLSYPNKQLKLIETPVTFVSYPLLSTVAQEFSQPEILLLSENGVLSANANFPEQSRRIDMMSERTNQVFTPQEKQTRLFRDFVRGCILENTEFTGFRENWTNLPPHSGILPLYFNYRYHFYSEKWPLIQVALEYYLAKQTQEGGGRGMMFRMFRGMTDYEKANLLLAEKNLLEILKSERDHDLSKTVLKLKGEYLFKMIESKIGRERLDRVLMSFLAGNKSCHVKAEELMENILRESDYDFGTFYEQWQSERSLPGFQIQDIDAFRVMDGDRTRYQVKFKLINPEPVSGLVEVIFRSGGFGDFRGFRERQPQAPGRLYPIDGKQAKEIGIVLDEQPQLLQINTMISQNIPLELTQPLRDWQDQPKAVPFMGERIIELPQPLPEIIVDDGDSGFSYSTGGSASFLKRWLSGGSESAQEKYKGITFWSPPREWTPTTLPDFYGKYIHSAVYIRSGKGEKKATFIAQIPESGTYDVYAWVARMPMRFGRPGGGERSREPMTGVFNYLVHHDDGVEKVAIDTKEVTPGWVLLGSHYLSKG